MESQFKTLGWFEKKWPEYKKDQPFLVHIGNRNGYAIAFAVSVLRVLFGATQGPKGGITGFLVVVDTSQSVMIDKLLCGNCEIMGSKEPISQLDAEIHFSKKNFDEVAPQYLAEVMQKWKDNPKHLTTLTDIVRFGNTSVLTLHGGAVSPR